MFYTYEIYIFIICLSSIFHIHDLLLFKIFFYSIIFFLQLVVKIFSPSL